MLHDEPHYPSAPPGTFQKGLEFQDHVCRLLSREGIILQNLCSKKFQLEVGENLQGFEIKLDLVNAKSGQLSIEISEKSDERNQIWVPSGIYRNDNSWLYIQGDYSKIWIFDKKLLVRWHKQKNPREHTEQTIRGFFLKHDDADRIAARVVVTEAAA